MASFVPVLTVVGAVLSKGSMAVTIPDQALVIDQLSFNAMASVLPASLQNGSSLFVPPGLDATTMSEKPFHVYNDEFYGIIGADPTLTLIAESASDPLFHEAVVWHRAADEVFFTQNAGSAAAGTGLNKSSIIEKISLSEVEKLTSLRNATGQVTVTTVGSSPQIINPNGATLYKGNIIYAGQGQGDTPSQLYVMNPNSPYNTTVLLNNFYGRQFNSLNDVAINPKSMDIYFTDNTYAHIQNFRPAPGLPNQIYRFNDTTGAVTVAADSFVEPNGVTFSPDGSFAYVTDSGLSSEVGTDYTKPSTIYRFDVAADGTFENRKVFAYLDAGLPDGIHTDTDGNVYAGCGDGVRVWNPSGVLLGRIYTGSTVANFGFAGAGRMVICAETKLYYATLNATGAYVEANLS